MNPQKRNWNMLRSFSASFDCSGKEPVPYSIYAKCYAEFLGTFIFMFCGTMQANVYDIMQPDGLTHSAFAHGFAAIATMATFGHISGAHFNPIVSWAVFLCGSLPIFHLPFYILSQFAGGFSANLLTACLQRNRNFIQWTRVEDIHQHLNTSEIYEGFDRVRNSTWRKTILLTTQLAATSSGATHLNASNVWWEGLISETVTSYILVTVIIMVAVDTNKMKTEAPFIVGLTAMALIFATASITGTAMNPVRALTPQIVAEIVLSNKTLPAKFWRYHYIYWIGPFSGSTIAVIGYRLILSRSSRIVI